LSILARQGLPLGYALIGLAGGVIAAVLSELIGRPGTLESYLAGALGLAFSAYAAGLLQQWQTRSR
jgi:hypothetical protein